MIEAKKSALFSRFFHAHAGRRIRRTFGGMWIRGLDRLERVLADGSCLVVSNHTAWWDPLVALVVTGHLVRSDAYAMMDAKNLRTFPFFGRVGAFGVDIADPKDGARGIRHAAALLDRPGRLVWIFSQGRERPVTERPLEFAPGSGAVARLAGVPSVPIAIRYEFGPVEKPWIWLFVGEPLPPPSSRRTSSVELASLQAASVTAELDAIEGCVRTGAREGLAAYLAERPSVVEGLATKLLGWLTR